MNLEACGLPTPVDHPEDVGAVHTVSRERAITAHCPEQRPLLLLSDSGGRKVLVDVLLGVVMSGHLVPLAAFLVEPEPPALAGWEVVLNPHSDCCAHARKAE